MAKVIEFYMPEELKKSQFSPSGARNGARRSVPPLPQEAARNGLPWEASSSRSRLCSMQSSWSAAGQRSDCTASRITSPRCDSARFTFTGRTSVWDACSNSGLKAGSCSITREARMTSSWTLTARLAIPSCGAAIYRKKVRVGAQRPEAYGTPGWQIRIIAALRAGVLRPSSGRL
jgi:hypothetical protein